LEEKPSEIKKPRIGLLRRLYDWVLHWAATPYGLVALFAISFFESSFFPIPPDVLLIALVMSKPAGWVRAATVCTVASVLGAVLGYFIGWGFWGLTQDFFFAYVFSPEAFYTVMARYDENATIAIFTAALTPIPFKVFTIAAGVGQISLVALILGSIIGRGGRFFVVAALLAKFGEPMKAFIDRYFEWLTILFSVLLIGGFILVRYVL
jgi:membrane protein YqaA with SNARE-associated domain